YRNVLTKLKSTRIMGFTRSVKRESQAVGGSFFIDLGFGDLDVPRLGLCQSNHSDLQRRLQRTAGLRRRSAKNELYPIRRVPRRVQQRHLPRSLGLQREQSFDGPVRSGALHAAYEGRQEQRLRLSVGGS